MHSQGYTTRGDVDNHGLTAHPHPQWFVDYLHVGSREMSRREVHGPNPPRPVSDGQTLTVGHFDAAHAVPAA